jgi:predicted AlkP superfamily phosphohydrolase/phosphomutase
LLAASLLLAGVTAAETPAATAVAADRLAKVLVIGFDGMDPDFLRQFVDEGVMPNFARFMSAGDFKPLGTAIPPQSPVAWANFITGQNAGGHGIFDFIHRKPETLLPYLSTSESQPPSKWWRIGQWKFPRDGGPMELKRHGDAFWEHLAAAGVDVTIFKVPSNFPPVECDARTLSGMGTPDILGTYGIFSYITDHPPADTDVSGGRVITVRITDGRFETEIPGPVNSYREGDPESAASVGVTIDPVHPAATFQVGDDRFLLQEGEWSDWITLNYEMIPWLKSVSGICRFYLMEVRPHFRLYVTPVQLDPMAPEMPISTPAEYSRELAGDIGLYYTQGLPDDTKALEEQVFTDADYVSQSTRVLEERLTQFRSELDRFCQLDTGFLFFYFNSPDQTCHMFWRNMDPESPMYADAEGLFRDHIRHIYQRVDEALGMAVASCGDETLIIAMSDHGFAPYHRSFHVNSWLLQNGYLHLRPGVRNTDVAFLSGIDWTRTRAYAIGINGLYLNLRGREKRGIVAPGAQREELLQELAIKLEAVVDPQDGQQAIKYAYRADKIYSGPYRDSGPDIIIGYDRGFRGSNESALGEIPDEIFTDNLLKWSGDHCMAADEVPGIIVANRKIRHEGPSLLDMAPTILRLFGLEPTPEMVGGDIFAESDASPEKGES